MGSVQRQGIGRSPQRTKTNPGDIGIQVSVSVIRMSAYHAQFRPNASSS